MSETQNETQIPGTEQTDLSSELAKLKLELENTQNELKRKNAINDALSKENKQKKEELNARMSEEEKLNAEREAEKSELEKLRQEIEQSKVEKAKLEAEKTLSVVKSKLTIDEKKFNFDTAVSSLLGENCENITKNATVLNNLLNAVIESVKFEETNNNFNNHTDGIKNGKSNKTFTLGERIAKSNISQTDSDKIKENYK